MLPKTLMSDVRRPRRVCGPSRQRLLLVVLVPWLALSHTAHGFDMESDAPISVKADNARLDDSAGRATYTGNVQIQQDQTRLFADRVELYRDAQGLSRIEAFGNPARYEHPQTPEAPATDARAAEIEFLGSENLLTFREDAVIRQAGDVFRGDIIRYNTEERVVTAERAGTGEGSQVEMIIQPRRGNDGENGTGGRDGAAESQ